MFTLMQGVWGRGCSAAIKPSQSCVWVACRRQPQPLFWGWERTSFDFVIMSVLFCCTSSAPGQKKPKVQPAFYFCNFTMTLHFSDVKVHHVCTKDCSPYSSWFKCTMWVKFSLSNTSKAINNHLSMEELMPHILNKHFNLENVSISPPWQWLAFGIFCDSLWISNHQKPNSHTLKNDSTALIWDLCQCCVSSLPAWSCCQHFPHLALPSKRALINSSSEVLTT